MDAGGRVRVAARAYIIKWTDIIRGVGFLGQNCPYELIANLGKATSRGFDLELTTMPFDGFTLAGAIGYNNAEFDESIRIEGAQQDVITEGHTLGGSPWTVAVSGAYEFDFGDLPAYVRSDYLYRSRNTGLVDVRDSNYPEYDPLLRAGPAIHDLRARVKALQKFASLHAHVHNHFNSERHLVDRETYKTRRSAALAEWQSLMA